MALGLGPSGVSLEESLIGLTPPGTLLSPGTYGLMSRMPGCGTGPFLAMGGLFWVGSVGPRANGRQNRRIARAWPAALYAASPYAEGRPSTRKRGRGS